MKKVITYKIERAINNAIIDLNYALRKRKGETLMGTLESAKAQIDMAIKFLIEASTKNE